MRLRSTVVAVIGLLAGPVRGQYRNGLGNVNGLAPRSWPQAVAESPRLSERDGSCAGGQHPCSDVNSTLCCYNTKYCIINLNWEAQCCDIGSDCANDTPCDAEHYYANQTTVTTITASASLAAVSTITQAVCSGRSCSGSFYGCPSSLGGHCCGFGQNCATNTAGAGICIGTSSSSTATATATPPSTSTSLPTGTVVEHKSQGLGTGAKAGLAIGIIAAAALVIGALAYLCLRRRRNARSGTTVTATTAQELPSITPGGRRHDGAGDGDDAGANGPQMSEVDAYSYGYTPSSTGLSRGGNGPAQGDYFGQMANGVTGTQQQQQQQQQHQDQPASRDGMRAPVEMSTHASLHRRPPEPHARMGSHGSEADGSQSELANTSSRGPSPVFGRGGPASPVDSIAGRFELPGDFDHGTPASGHEVFHDAQESVGRSRSRMEGSATRLPQPVPTPGSEMSEFATPSPMSREDVVAMNARGPV